MSLAYALAAVGFAAGFLAYCFVGAAVMAWIETRLSCGDRRIAAAVEAMETEAAR